MASPPSAVQGELERVTFENDSTGFRVWRLRAEPRGDVVTVVGVLPAVAPGARLRVSGRWARDPRHGVEFRADSAAVLAPSTLAGLERYLGSGLVPGVGPAFARRIVGAFGLETLRVLDEAPERLDEVPGLGHARARRMAEAWTDRRAVNDVHVFLRAHGASPSLAARIQRHYGREAMAVVSQSPYRLALDVHGVGFATADRIARSLGTDPTSPERAQAGALHVLGEAANAGHTWTARDALVDEAARMLEVDPAGVDRAVGALAGTGRVVVDSADDGTARVWPSALHAAERLVARRLASLLSHPGRPLGGAAGAIGAFERSAGVRPAADQARAIERAARDKVLVVTGGPGVGKTTLVRALIALLGGGGNDVRLAAPTGRAAKRLSEATGRQASTLHRLLEIDPRTGRFQRCAESRLVADAVVVDEASMVDLPLAAALLDALPDRARLVLVGDVDQLPPVGPGAFLRDAIASGTVPTVRLTEVFRQAEASGIVRNAHRIHAGRMPVGATVSEGAGAGGPDADFFVVPRRDPDQAAAIVRELVAVRIPRRFGLHPVRDVQVIAPMHRGAAGATALNDVLQQTLNPAGAQVARGARVLRVGDKVMQTRNDYSRDVYNGDIGQVISIDAGARSVVVRIDGRDVVCEEDDLDDLVLSYAITVHKSQGSEYPAVVVPVLTSHYVMLSRNLLYTAVTRGKRLVVLVADPRALGIALGETRKEDRRSGLANRIRRAAESAAG